MKTQFQIKSFNELSKEELYNIIRLRVEVFVVEQDCPYQDLDFKDQESLHLMGYRESTLISYARLLPKGISYPNHCSIGRVVSDLKYRGHGIGRELMLEAIALCKQEFENDPIKISAQHYLLNFYRKLGFSEIGEIYPEDNIPHIAMVIE
jgi:ElaA protein